MSKKNEPMEHEENVMTGFMFFLFRLLHILIRGWAVTYSKNTDYFSFLCSVREMLGVVTQSADDKNTRPSKYDPAAHGV